MAGMSDGVNKLWIIRKPRGSLDIDGYSSNLEAIDHLIRCCLVVDPSCASEIQATVDGALRHLDEEEECTDGE